MWQYILIFVLALLVLYTIMHIKVKIMKKMFKLIIFIGLIFLILFTYNYYNDLNLNNEGILTTGAYLVNNIKDNIKDSFDKEEISEYVDELKTLKKIK